MPINTTRSWARVIDDYRDIPLFFKEPFAAFSLSCAEPPYAVFAPPDRSFSRKQNARIICVSGDEIRIYEKHRKQLICTAFPIRGIQYIETGSILLYSWIKISGMAGDRLDSVTWTFNTSTEPILKPVIDKARRLKTPAGADASFDSLLPLGYKYANMAKSAVSPAENALQVLTQPEIKEPRFRILGKTFYRTLLPSAVVILTARELILLSVNTDKSVKAGGTKRFIPLDKIMDVSVAPAGRGLIRCTLRLPGAENIEIGLEYGRLDELNAMLEGLRPA